MEPVIFVLVLITASMLVAVLFSSIFKLPFEKVYLVTILSFAIIINIVASFRIYTIYSQLKEQNEINRKSDR